MGYTIQINLWKDVLNVPQGIVFVYEGIFSYREVCVWGRFSVEVGCLHITPEWMISHVLLVQVYHSSEWEGLPQRESVSVFLYLKQCTSLLCDSLSMLVKSKRRLSFYRDHHHNCIEKWLHYAQIIVKNCASLCFYTFINETNQSCIGPHQMCTACSSEFK